MTRSKATATTTGKAKRSRGSVRKKRRARARSARRAAPPARDPLDHFIAAAGRALGLPIEPAWQPAIKTNLSVTLRLAAAYADFPLPDEAEPAPVFTA